MKCLVLSDSHGDSFSVRRILNMHSDAEVIFFLGDGLSDLEPFANNGNIAILAVRGNCDRDFVLGNMAVKKTDSINIEGHRIVFTHGDLYGVKYGIDGITRLADECFADVVLFGHTHEPLEKYIPRDDGGIYLFNPGSISGYKPSYGVMNITERGILLSHGTL
jgi:putative phosphoesterase